MTMAGEQKRVYRFKDFTLVASERRLRRCNQEIYLRPKTFETLLYLVEQHGHLASIPTEGTRPNALPSGWESRRPSKLNS